MRRFSIVNDSNAVIDLPMRLTVAVIIGGVALAAIMGFILKPCMFPEKMVVYVDPMTQRFTSGGGPEDFQFTVKVTDTKGHSVSNALVIIKGLGKVTSGYTSANGEVTLVINGVQLQEGRDEDYLDVNVKAPCFESFIQQDMIKITRGPETP